ncbi:MAG: DUF1566 domain-containing protein [Desulfuromonadales bacterium]
MQRIFILIATCLTLNSPLSEAYAALPPAPVPQTGQTSCYDAAGGAISCSGTGQDGELKSGVVWPDPRFTDNANGTVSDNLTGLIWTKDANSPGPAACGPATTKTWQGALDYADCLNSNYYLGYNDWRVPSIRELGGLVDKSRTNPALPAGHPFTSVQSSGYWAGSTYAFSTSNAWLVGMIGGFVTYVSKSYNGIYVWPVRSGQSSAPAPTPKSGQISSYAARDDGALLPGVTWPAPRFTDNTNGTVTDNLTGLIWLKNANCFGTQTWNNALIKSNTLASGACGLTDASKTGEWHLANSNELWSLVDYGHFSPALPVGHPFTSVQSVSYWSGTAYANGTSNAWYVDLNVGSVLNYDETYSLYVWPVRSVQSGAFATLTLSKSSGSGAGTITSNPTGISCGVTCSANYTIGTQVTLTAAPDNGSTFTGWSGACSGTGTCVVTMDMAKSVGAKFDDTYQFINNIALNKPVTADYTPGFGTPSLITNGVFAPEATSWGDSNYAVQLDGKLTVDLGQVYTGINRLKVQTDNNDTYRVEYSIDGITWSTFYDVAMITGYGLNTRYSGILAPVSARYLRIYQTGGDGLYSVSELQVFSLTNGTCGSSNGTTALTAPTSNLCSTGTASATTGNGPWSWTCNGSNGGTNATCTTTTPSVTWRHQGDGKVYGMATDGSSITGGAQFWQEGNPAWSIVGQGDFDGDGIKDFVWQNSSTGQVYLMLMASPTATKSGSLIYTESNTDWKIVATGDINGDGKTDLIWWNKTTGQVHAMLLNGTAVAGGGMIYTEPNTAWKIVAAADFNGNGTVELLWWNSSTGQTAIGQTNGTSASTANLIWTEPDTNWRIAGAGDLDGDGKADIIWHNRITGQVYGMQTNGSSVTNGAMMYTEASTNWEIVSVGNFNSDNKADLLWWNQQTGQVYLMPMNGLAVGSGGALLYTEPDLTWKIQSETEWRDNLYGRGATTTTK